ncbi:MAG TPA: FAD-dependent oxidoreductase [Candidatus Sulfotelmatobacter sp.]|jgi:UDP-galactopyranose mutase|nr:FAD-dependent oxidoreductase [Candidatus Sulfotelmatobacter sp.]
MSLQVDFLVVGSGLTGATIARTLADAGCEVLVLERRNHIGGNVHDHVHPSGVRIHTYGPHYFRTNSEEIWRYVNRFAEFFPYEAVVKTLIDGRLEQWPITAQYINREVGTNWQTSPDKCATNFEEACLGIMPRLVYEKFVKGYTEKQWGQPATSLSAKLASRFDVRQDNDQRFCLHKYQGIPRVGYAEFTRQLLHGIPVVLNCDFLALRAMFSARQMLIFTGAIDEFFSYDLGKLDYRAQSREHVFVESQPFVQACGQVNNPSPDHGSHIRTLEWKHMMPPEQVAHIQGTVITRESPYSPQNSDHYEYPFPDQRNQLLYEAYRSRAAGDARLMICGRLGEYRYFDMDQAIGRALRIARMILRSMPLRLRDYSSAARIHPELLSAAGQALLTSKKTSEAAGAL